VRNSHLALCVLSLLLLTGCSSYGPKITVGDCDIYYKDGATREDAQKAADVLVKDKYIDPSKSVVKGSVRILKPGGKYAVEFVFNEKSINDENSVSTMRTFFASDIATEAFGGAPTDLHLCDTHFVTEKNEPVEYVKRTSFGNGSLLKTSKDLSDEELKKLLIYCNKTFGKARDVLIGAKKNGALPVISVIVPDAKSRTDKFAQEDFKPIAIAISKNVFDGATVELDLCDAHFQPGPHCNS
jgi:hypothetical protein